MFTPEMKHCAPYEPIALLVTGTNWTTVRAIGHAWKMANGTWFLSFKITGSVSVGVTSFTPSIDGVVFANNYSVCLSCGSSSASPNGVTNTNSTISLSNGSAATIWRFSGEVELTSKPTWIQEN